MGDGFTWDTKNREQDITTARRTWEQAVRLLREPSFDMVILDELNIVLRYDYLLGRGLSRQHPRLMVLGSGNELHPSLLLPLQERFEPTISTHDSRVAHDFSST